MTEADECLPLLGYRQDEFRSGLSFGFSFTLEPGLGSLAVIPETGAMSPDPPNLNSYMEALR